MYKKHLVALLALLVFVLPSEAQNAGDTVRLQSDNPQGVPVHPADGDSSYVRWANGTIGTILAMGPQSGWFQIRAGTDTGWVTRRYITVIVVEPDPLPEPPEDEQLAYTVGAWNLEHFRASSTRGFPENTNGGPTYPPRTPANLERIAQIIQFQIGARVLVLNEINGRTGTTRSDEMDSLAGLLGNGWQYELSRSGGSQRVAILFDTRAARRDHCVEFDVPSQSIQGSDVFARDPLVCMFTLLDGTGQPRNDFIVVALHLASSQDKTQNHNRAMAILRDRLNQARQDGTFPAGETDVLIGGDLNASRYDTRLEDFWEGYDAGGLDFVTLSPADGTDYHPTRLAGVPLAPRSQIDYLIASGVPNGLLRDLVQTQAHVHAELLLIGFDAFRQCCSDHLPVTVRIMVRPDDD